MQSISDYLSAEGIKNLAMPSNYRLGAQLAKEGRVELIENERSKIIAKVKGGQGSSGRTVTLKASKSGLEYSCTCSKKPDWFCKHCVAVGLAALGKNQVKTD